MSVLAPPVDTRSQFLHPNAGLFSRVAQVRLLGPVDALVGNEVRSVPGSRRKAVLAILALYMGETVSTDLLTEVVWSGRPPLTAANTLQSHVSYLRNILGFRDSIVSSSPGYRLQLGDSATDVAQAEDLVTQARNTGDPAKVASLLRAALALWRAEPMAELQESTWFWEQAERLNRIRAAAVRALVDARLTLGEHSTLVPELQDLTQKHPFDEGVCAQLMLALYRSGRQADALVAYQRLWRRLDMELGIEPSPPLRDLQTAILRHEPSIAAPEPPVAMAPPSLRLPESAVGLVGREVELECLNRLFARTSPLGAPRPMPIVAIAGQAKAGKTALAVTWSRRAAEQYPDGQIFLNLRGNDSVAPVDPTEAVRGILGTLGVPPHATPTGRDACVGLYRTLLATKRVLIVLDDARDAQQVRPLLPSSPGCAVLITSRAPLTPLVVTEGARSLTLTPFAVPTNGA